MTRRGEAFSEIERLIDGFDLGPDQKSALWLLAWSHQDRRVQRRVAFEALAHADAELVSP